MDKIMDFLGKYSDQIVKWGVTHGLRVLGIVIIIVSLYLLLRFGMKRFIHYYLRKEQEGSEKDKRIKTMVRILSALGGAILFATGLMMVISELGIDIKPVLASLGIGGVALGFGAQSLVKDLISGFFMLYEDQIRVGDVVSAAGQSGQVEKVGLRILVLRDLAGNRIVIPNSEIKQVTNMTYGYSRYVFDIGVAYKEDVDRVIGIMKTLGEQMQADPEFGPLINQPLEILGLDKFGDSAVIVKARFETQPIKQWVVGREFNRRLKIAFDKEGIEIPFPHRTIYLGQDQAKELGQALVAKSTD